MRQALGPVTSGSSVCEAQSTALSNGASETAHPPLM